jgi:hypothetical protein
MPMVMLSNITDKAEKTTNVIGKKKKFLQEDIIVSMVMLPNIADDNTETWATADVTKCDNGGMES